MLKIEGYAIDSLLKVNDIAQVYRATRLEDRLPVILYVCPPGDSVRDSRLQQLYGLISKLHFQGVPHALSLERVDRGLVMVLQAFQAQPLKAILTQRRFSIDEVLQIASSLAVILSRIHADRIIHTALQPRNILIREKSHEVLITGFERALPVNRERKLNPKADLLTEDLPYISPEQTGRMSKDMDFRSDLYSLGTTLYELLVGRPPFQAEPLELIHLHLAGTVLPPREAGRDDIPEALNQIVLKLLEKDPDRRYQTARGLHADLERLRHSTRTSFELGTDEVPDTLLLPAELYGRGHELDVLNRVFARVKDGYTELVVLSGQPGVGKTAVVKAFRKDLGREVFFLRGKFERLQRHTPYSALLEALSGWADHLLTSSDEDMAVWRDRLTGALGQIGGVMTDLVPNLQLVLGTQPPLPDLGPGETQNRIMLALNRFIACIAQPAHPMVLFLDDVQWADAASAALMEHVLDAAQPPALLLLASLRTSEQDDDSPFARLVNRPARKHRTRTLDIRPWTDEEANTFIADCLGKTVAETREPAQLIRRKTGNNPLFVRQFLLHSYNLGLIRFTPGSGWSWDAAAIERERIPDDFVGMMTDKIARLPAAARRVLELAGAIGNGFDPRTVAAVGELDEEAVAMGLFHLTSEGLVVPVGSQFNFTHDRIYEAAAGLQDAEAQADRHLKIGCYLMDQAVPDSPGEAVFSITKHLNPVHRLVRDPARKQALAALNLAAGRKSMQAAAYTTARDYFQMGLALAEAAGASWTDAYDLLFPLALGEAESLFLSGDNTAARQRFTGLCKRHLKPLDLARTIAHEVSMLYVTGHVDEALEAGLYGLERLDFPIPRYPSKRRLLVMLVRLRARLMRRSDADLLGLPVCTDPLHLARMHLLGELIIPSYFNRSRLAVYLGFISMELVLQHGHHPRSPMAVATYGLTLGAGWGFSGDRYRFGRLALRLMEAHGESRLSPRVGLLVRAYVEPWVRSAREILPRLAQNQERAMELGDLQFAVFSQLEHLALRICCGEHLAEIYDDAQAAIETTQRYGYESFRKAATRLGWFAACLRGDRKNLPHAGSSDPFHLEALKGERVRLTQYFVGPFAAKALFITGRHEEALELCRRLMPRLSAYVPFSRQHALNTFYLAMSSARVYPSASKRAKTKLRRHLAWGLRQFQTWARHGPAGHKTQALLLEAEMLRLQGDPRAWYVYTAADEHARGENLVHLSALTHERMGEFAREAGWQAEAAHQFHLASVAYHAWGAEAKVAWLQEHYAADTPYETLADDTPALPTESHETLSKVALDLGTVIAGSQAIAQEVELERVLERVMASAIENAGAQRGLLLLISDDALWLEAEGSVNGGFLRIPRMDPVDSQDQLPMSIVRYVQRTSETVVLGEAREQGLFRDDPYLHDARARSVLLMPIHTQNKFVGILYLENNLVGNAFTRERTEVLRVIAAQAAIALENARLYDELNLLNRDLEKRVEARTTELREANARLTVEVEERKKAEKDLVDLQSKLVETARRAGMTEVAIGVLHNVGNVLNSVTISATCLAESQKNSKLPQLDRLVELLHDHDEDLGHYLTEDTRGKLFPAYLEKLTQHLNRQREKDTDEIKKLSRHLAHAIEVIRAQQAEAGVKAVLEPVTPCDLMEQALKVLDTELTAADVAVSRTYETLPTLLIDKHKVLQILINLVKNAVQSVAAARTDDRRLNLALRRDGETVFEVADNGLGISTEHLHRVFSYGFTTKQDGNGYGLHNAANAATEMGGRLTVHSDGLGTGALFRLVLPLQENRLH